MSRYLQIHPSDNIAVALQDLEASATVTIGTASFLLAEPVPQGHKFSLCPISVGSTIVKYGTPIGHATTDIAAGCHIHTHNMATNLSGEGEYIYTPVQTDSSAPYEGPLRTFLGYRRSDGRIGIRNELWIIPTVGCVNDVARKIASLTADAFPQYKNCENIDAICTYPHPYGCSQLGDDQESTRKLLADLIRHPNAGGVLVLGLGCENSNIDVLRTYLGDADSSRIRFLNCQDAEDEIEDAMGLIADLLAAMATDRRTEVSLDKLVIGLKCGGSDGLSGITANPTVGRVSDVIIAAGGTTILTEVPEMFGAEQLLMNRCVSRDVFRDTVDLINRFKTYYTSHNLPVGENPSPGNKAGGITTLEDKSMGCVQKSGSQAVVGVLRYAQQLTGSSRHGLYLLESPGNDLIAATALAASGAQMILFTTGRGTPFSSPVPTLKISTNSGLAMKKSHWIDYNCGVLLQGSTYEETADELLNLVIATASGLHCCAEQAGYRDMAIWRNGVTL